MSRRVIELLDEVERQVQRGRDLVNEDLAYAAGMYRMEEATDALLDARRVMWADHGTEIAEHYDATLREDRLEAWREEIGERTTPVAETGEPVAQLVDRALGRLIELVGHGYEIEAARDKVVVEMGVQP